MTGAISGSSHPTSCFTKSITFWESLSKQILLKYVHTITSILEQLSVDSRSTDSNPDQWSLGQQQESGADMTDDFDFLHGFMKDTF